MLVITLATTGSSFVDGDVYIAAIIGAIITGGITYVIKRRGTSGNVKNSDADTIFKEGDKIRQWLTETLEAERKENRAELEYLNRRIDILEKVLRDNGLEVPPYAKRSP